MIRLEVGEEGAGRRLDRFLKKYLKSAPLSLVYRLIRKDVKVNGKRASAERLLEATDIVELFLPKEKIEELSPERKGARARRQFGIVYEDENVLIVNKPFGLLTHGDSVEKKNTLANQVEAYLIESGAYSPARQKTFVPAPANRLDRNTTGLVLFGKTPAGLRELAALARGEGLQKRYLTLAKGRLAGPLEIRRKVARDREQNKTLVFAENAEQGVFSETRLLPLCYGRGYTLVEATLLTGRTHQIRAHLAEAGHPVFGDRKYGDAAANREASERFGLTTQLLHAWKLGFPESLDGVLASLAGKNFEAPLPTRFLEIAKALGCDIKL